MSSGGGVGGVERRKMPERWSVFGETVFGEGGRVASRGRESAGVIAVAASMPQAWALLCAKCFWWLVGSVAPAPPTPLPRFTGARGGLVVSGQESAGVMWVGCGNQRRMREVCNCTSGAPALVAAGFSRMSSCPLPMVRMARCSPCSASMSARKFWNSGAWETALSHTITPSFTAFLSNGHQLVYCERSESRNTKS